METIARLLAVTVLVAVAGCSAPNASRDLPAGRGSSPIVGGQPDDGHEAVVLIQTNNFMCTGTVIAPGVVLTAAHCVVTNESCVQPNCTEIAAAQFTVMGGREPFANADWSVGVSAVHAAPDYDGANYTGGDMGILILDQEAPVTPIPVLYKSAGSDAMYLNGTPFLAVGYGLANAPSGPDTSGTKRVAAMTITDQNLMEFFYGGSTKNTCSGDSGGPALVALEEGGEVVIGVVSYGDQNCNQFGANIRTDAEDVFISTHAPNNGTGGPGPTPTPTPGEPGDDDDDDGLPGNPGGSGANGGVGCSVGAVDASSGSLAAIFTLAGLVAISRRRRVART